MHHGVAQCASAVLQPRGLRSWGSTCLLARKCISQTLSMTSWRAATSVRLRRIPPHLQVRDPAPRPSTPSTEFWVWQQSRRHLENLTRSIQNFQELGLEKVLNSKQTSRVESLISLRNRISLNVALDDAAFPGQQIFPQIGKRLCVRSQTSKLSKTRKPKYKRMRTGITSLDASHVSEELG